MSETTDYIAIKNEWRVPVMIKGQYRSLLTVSGYPGNYSVSGMGDPDLARDLQQKSEGANEKDEYYVLRIFPLLAEFFVHEGDNSFAGAVFVPLGSAIKEIPSLGAKSTYSLTEVQQIIKEAVAKKATDATPATQKRKPKKQAAE